MERKRPLAGAAALLAAALLCWGLWGASARAAAREARIVRIPCGINDLLYLDESGQPAGRYVSYLTKLAQVNNWQFEYVETTWTQAVELLENGGLDLLFPTNYSAQRAAAMDYSTLLGGYTAPALFARPDSGYDYQDYEEFDGARIAVTKGSSNEQALADLARSRGFSYEPVYIDSNSEKAQALARGDVDLIVLTAYNNLSNNVLVAVMDANPFYITVKKGNAELFSELNEGMQQLVMENPELMADTFRQCLLDGSGGMLAYTPEERDFVESGRPVVVGVYENTKPLVCLNPDGSYGGIYADLLEHIRENSGINMVLRPIGRDRDWRELVKSGELDFFLGEPSSLGAKDPDLISTNAFFPYVNVLLTRNDRTFSDLSDPVIALTSGRVYLSGYVSESLGIGEIRYYDGAKDCIIAVLEGEADGAVMNSIEYNYQSKNPRFSAMLEWENYRLTADGGLMAAADVDPVMFSAVNKAVGLLYDDFVRTTINDNLNMPYEPSLADSLYIMRHTLVIVGAVALVVIAAAVVIHRIRRRQRAVLAQVQEHESRQLRILAALSRNYDAIYYTDLDAGVCQELWVNKEAASARGAGRVPLDSDDHSGAVRRYVASYVRPEDSQALLTLSEPAAIMRRFRECPDFSVRYRVKPNELGQEYFEMHLVDMSEKGREHAMVFGTRCIDEVVRAEADQRQLLQAALEAANKASAAKSEFLSKMSHDIRTPMNAIIGMTAIADAHLDDAERVRDALGKISSASRYLLGLINEVLDMSKIESGAITLNEEAFNLSDLLNNLLTMVQPQIDQHGHKLEVHIQDIQHEDVLGDSLRIQQAFVNIMDNAVKYTPDGGVIRLRVREIPMRSRRLAGYEFVFQDNGIGMPKEYLEKIFEPFSRAEDLRVSRIQGTGLGMAITQNIVHQMDGSIKVESEEGKGTTFTVTIFLKFQKGQELDTSGLAGRPVLVVDDDADACASVCELLNQIGMKGASCTRGQEAVELIGRTMGTSEQFYAAILDWKMPEMDGVETARAIRKVAGSDMPVIILSAYDWSDIELEARAAGVDAFLSKPVFKSGLIRQFKSLDDLGERGARDEDVREQMDAIRHSDYSGARALLVEDNDLNREIAKEILEMAGLRVEEAENGREAVDKVMSSETGYYDIIFMDIQMPVMSGYDAAMAIRGLGRGDSRSVPIVAMTANAFVEDIQAAKAAGMNEHLAKPIDLEKLHGILKKYLGE